jgi:hypothetical protein
MEGAITRGPHLSALDPAAAAQHLAEVNKKAERGQAKVVLWDDIKDNPPTQLKISPLAMIPHKSCAFRAILDLLFNLRLKSQNAAQSVNDTTTLLGPATATAQFGQSLSRIVHAIAEVEDDEKIFMAKYDIKDGFWRLQCTPGDKWNFAYVLPQDSSAPIQLVVPNSLQMGWVESPTYFCAASEMARNVATQYIKCPIGLLPPHCFAHYAMTYEKVLQLPTATTPQQLHYILEVYVNDCIPMAIATSPEQLQHITTAVMHGIHDVFPPSPHQHDDPISVKKLEKLHRQWALCKDILGFTFDGEHKTMILEEHKRKSLLDILQTWVRLGQKGCTGIPFEEFQSGVQKIRHAFTAIPAGKGLLTPCNTILSKQPAFMWLSRNRLLQQAIADCRTLLHKATKTPS